MFAPAGAHLPYIALDWLLTGRVIGVEEAWRHGVISRISEGSALEEARLIAVQIAQKNPLATQAVKPSFVMG